MLPFHSFVPTAGTSVWGARGEMAYHEDFPGQRRQPLLGKQHSRFLALGRARDWKSFL